MKLPLAKGVFLCHKIVVKGKERQNENTKTK